MSLENVIVTVTKGDKEKEKFMISLPNIRNLQGYLKGFWDFDIYKDCFPKRNKLSDVDGQIELNGHTLQLEFKATKFAITAGQVLKAIRQAKYSNITTVFVFGKTDQPEEYLLFSPELPEGSGYLPCDREILTEILASWVQYSSANNLVENRSEEWGLAKRYC